MKMKEGKIFFKKAKKKFIFSLNKIMKWKKKNEKCIQQINFFFFVSKMSKCIQISINFVEKKTQNDDNYEDNVYQIKRNYYLYMNHVCKKKTFLKKENFLFGTKNDENREEFDWK